MILGLHSIYAFFCCKNGTLHHTADNVHAGWTTWLTTSEERVIAHDSSDPNTHFPSTVSVPSDPSSLHHCSASTNQQVQVNLGRLVLKKKQGNPTAAV